MRLRNLLLTISMLSVALVMPSEPTSVNASLAHDFEHVKLLDGSTADVPTTKHLIELAEVCKRIPRAEFERRVECQGKIDALSIKIGAMKGRNSTNGAVGSIDPLFGHFVAGLIREDADIIVRDTQALYKTLKLAPQVASK